MDRIEDRVGRAPIRLRARLRALTLCSEPTISRWWTDRASVSAATDARLSEAAKVIGVRHPDEEGP